MRHIVSLFALMQDHMTHNDTGQTVSLHLEQALVIIVSFIVAIFGLSLLMRMRATHRANTTLSSFATFVTMGITGGLGGALSTILQTGLGNALGPIEGLLLGGVAGGFVGATVDGVSQALAALATHRLRLIGWLCCGIGVVFVIVQTILVAIAPTLP